MDININIKTINKVLTKLRLCFSHDLKDYYKFNKLCRASEGSNIHGNQIL